MSVFTMSIMPANMKQCIYFLQPYHIRTYVMKLNLNFSYVVN